MPPSFLGKRSELVRTVVEIGSRTLKGACVSAGNQPPRRALGAAVLPVTRRVNFPGKRRLRGLVRVPESGMRQVRLLGSRFRVDLGESLERDYWFGLYDDVELAVPRRLLAQGGDFVDVWRARRHLRDRRVARWGRAGASSRRAAADARAARGEPPAQRLRERRREPRGRQRLRRPRVALRAERRRGRVDEPLERVGGGGATPSRSRRRRSTPRSRAIRCGPRS